MKRTLSLILVLAMIIALALPTLAEDAGTDPAPSTISELEPPAPPTPPEPTTQPTEPTTQPTEPSTQPTDPTTQPTDPTTQPTDPSTQPTDPSTQPTDPSTQPTDPSTQPTDPSTQPTDPSSQPTDPSTQPTNPSTQPTVPTAPNFTQPPAFSGIPVITKHPTAETVKEGGYAEFVARANYCNKIVWRLLSPTGGSDVLAKDAPIRFPGLVVTGLETERLGLDHIPKELDGWRVRAEFVGRDGTSLSEAVPITVTAQALQVPTIVQHPAGANLAAGQTTTLRVVAQPGSTEGQLIYQWYRSASNSNIGGKAILGATQDTYTPDRIDGTTYYYCAVRATVGNEISAAAKTLCAPVTCEVPAATTVPVTQPTTAPETTESVTEAATTEPAETMPVATAPRRSNTLLVIVVAVIIFIAVLGILATVLILKFYPKDDEEPVRKKKQPTSKKAAAPRAPIVENPLPEEEGWDDLSDLNLSYYLDEDNH